MTKFVQLGDVPLVIRKSIRTDRMDYRRLLAGTAGAQDNFKLILATIDSTYSGPRHHHNFEQIKLQFEGAFDYHGIGKQGRGMIGYFPEGTYYGPFTSSDENYSLLLQFGGASHAGYMSDEEYIRSMDEMHRVGDFKDGIFTGVGFDGQKIRKDAYEATWEHTYKRKIEYPKPRYNFPVIMQPENFSWVPTTDGCAYKHLGDFGECYTRVGFVRLDGGATMRLSQGSIYFVMSGSGRSEGGDWTPQSAIHVSPGEEIEITAHLTAELLHVGLPRLSENADVPNVLASARAMPNDMTLV